MRNPQNDSECGEGASGVSQLLLELEDILEDLDDDFLEGSRFLILEKKKKNFNI